MNGVAGTCHKLVWHVCVTLTLTQSTVVRKKTNARILHHISHLSLTRLFRISPCRPGRDFIARVYVTYRTFQASHYIGAGAQYVL